jgi:tRNA threonylcarbamoyladenosine biosynthesis protein TsaE
MSGTAFEMATASADGTRATGAALGGLVRPGDVIALTGDLGAGKTVITQGLASSLGVAGHVTSPTFNILVVHRGEIDLAHFDLYRLEHEWQLEDIDFWGVLESDAVSVIEWGDRFPGALPEDVLTAVITITGDESRHLSLRASGPRSAALAREWAAACAHLEGVSPASGGEPS